VNIFLSFLFQIVRVKKHKNEHIDRKKINIGGG